MKEIILNLTDEEATHLTVEMNLVLRQFDTSPYAGRQFTNPIMASAFNKVYCSLTGKNHENCTEERMKYMEERHKAKRYG